MAQKEAQARIKINKLLEDSGWRFFDDKDGKANIQLEPGVKLEELGDDLENAPDGYIDYLLLDLNGKALLVLEAKRESIDPLSAKERARLYARNAGARYVVLSNGNQHFFWDTKSGSPEIITRLPTQESISQFQSYTPDPAALVGLSVAGDYVMQSQAPGFDKDPTYLDENTREQFIKDKRLRRLRQYQLDAILALQNAAKAGKTRYLFEMATGTGKTLTAAGVIKLFLKSGNAKRVLFLVDRLELEDQAFKAFKNYLKGDYTVSIFKNSRESWQNAEIVVSTIQSLLAGDRYRREFSPTDFELVISDEAHRSIGGNSRAVFEYFVGYKLGLTATPKDYLRGFDGEGADTQREFERRQLLSTYKTFGCEAGEPTYRYSLLDGVRDGYLINPITVDARTEITSQLLTEKGYAVHSATVEGQPVDDVFYGRDFERRFFNEETNIAMCKALLDNGLHDPIAQQYGKPLFGKAIVFCVSQRHAGRIANILNKLAQAKWPGLYDESDFAVQITSSVSDAQKMTTQFANNSLSGRSAILPGYDTSKTRVAVTVGMMTTGYDCEDLLNLALLRPIFSPSDFIQMKGRGTRIFAFKHEDSDSKQIKSSEKTAFKLFDFFANCDYFDKKYKYDEALTLPRIEKAPPEIAATGVEYVDGEGKPVIGPVVLDEEDTLEALTETPVGPEGMKVDREMFREALDEDFVGNEQLKTLWENGDLEAAEAYTKKAVFNNPKHFLNLEKIRAIFNTDRRLSVREVLEYAFGQRDTFEQKDELLESEWAKFMETTDIDQSRVVPAKHYFKAYIVDPELREIIEKKEYARLNQLPTMSFEEFQLLNGLRDAIPQYIKDYVPLNTFME